MRQAAVFVDVEVKKQVACRLGVFEKSSNNNTMGHATQLAFAHAQPFA